MIQLKQEKIFFFVTLQKMEERTEETKLSQSRDRSSQETPKKRVALTGAKYVDNKARSFYYSL